MVSSGTFKAPRRSRHGVSLIEVMVVMVTVSLMLGGILNFFGKQMKFLAGQKIVADVQSLGTIGFFMIARDIRRAGSNPEGAMSLAPGAPVPFEEGETDGERIRIYADINGDKVLDGPGEDVSYIYTDSDGDGTKDTIVRKEGTIDQLFIQNVSTFTLTYVMSDGTFTDTPSPTSEVRRVEITIGITADRNDPATGKAITRTFHTIAHAKNFIP